MNAQFHYYGIKCEKCGTFNTKMIWKWRVWFFIDFGHLIWDDYSEIPFFYSLENSFKWNLLLTIQYFAF